MKKLARWLGAAAVGLIALAAAPASQDSHEGIAFITQPSERHELPFEEPGMIAQVAVKPGETVKAGQVLLALDDRQQKLELEALKLEADSTLPVDAARVTRDTKQVAARRVQGMYDRKVATDLELEEAKLNAELAELQLQNSEMELKQKKLKAQVQAVRLDNMQLKSPVDGVVERIDRGLGEVVDPSKAVCVVVRNDPLWVEAHLPTSQSLQLRVGQEVAVRYPGQENRQSTAAKIIYLAPVVDAASDTQLVRLELPNPTGMASGLKVLVDLPGKLVSR